MTSEGYLVFQRKITDTFKNVFYFHSLKKKKKNLSFQFQKQTCSNLKIWKMQERKKRASYPEFLPGISMIAFEDMPY